MTNKLLEGKLYFEEFEKFDQYIDIAKQTGFVPRGFEIAVIQDEIQQNDDDVIRLRFNRHGEASPLYGEHFSMMIRKSDHLILGFVDLIKENTVRQNELGQLPTERETKTLVKKFFADFAPNYLHQLEDYAYRSPYGENVVVDGAEQAVAGTEWKWYEPQKGDWGWVVFGKHRQPIIYERNIRWVNSRTTEKWLHDRYLDTGLLAFVPVSVNQ